MRDIEFRFWSESPKKYFYGDEAMMCLIQQQRFNKKLDHSSAAPAWNHCLDGSSFEQYTGLLDKNGKKIFESDIVELHDASGIYFQAIVEFNDGCFDVNYLNGFQEYDYLNKFNRTRDYLKCFTVNHAVKVISNIHE